jgi:tetratricopeptide (TPR) repeat protein
MPTEKMTRSIAVLILLLAIPVSCLAGSKADSSTKPADKPKDLCFPPPAGVAPSLPARILDGQGSSYIHFPITTSNPKAQEFFTQGVAQMHSFWANEAERSFLQAAALDPEAPMPWWGIAMVAAGDYRPRFQLDVLDLMFGKNKSPIAAPPNTKNRAKEAMEKALALAAVPGKASDLEKMYIAAIAARRLPTAGADPDEGYLAGLKALVAKYPNEIEARLYLALHTMRGFTLPDRQPRPGTMEAVEMLRALLIEAPDHPAVHHYLIHGFEGATFAKDAWLSCKRYAELVPNIPHALHMPGHIYSQTGRWDDAVKSFTDAAANELGWMNADKLYGRGHHGHNVHYQSTALAFSGQYDKAIAAAEGLLELGENPREKSQVDNFTSIYRQGWFAMMRALVQGQRWDDILAGKLLPNYSRPREQAWMHWARGLAYSAKGDTANAKLEAKRMDESFRDFVAKVKRQPTEELQVARLELDGHIAASAHRYKRAMNVLQTASDRERRLVYSEPPYYPRPVATALGDMADKAGDRTRAAKAYRASLEQFPGGIEARKGLERVSGNIAAGTE